MSERELFELALSGGPSERLYRRARPEVLRLPWGEKLGVRVSAAQRVAARQEWTIAALQEYRSASEQFAVLAALVRARVPLDLSATAARFPLDELAHAEICARVANELGGGAPVSFDADQVFAAPARTKRRPLAHACVLVARLFGVGEGWSHGFLSALRAETRVPLLRAVWKTLVRDEAVHARFAWMVLAWARTELRPDEWHDVESAAKDSVAEKVASFGNLAVTPPEHFSEISPLGPGGHAAYLARAQRSLEAHVIRRFAGVGMDVRPRG